MKTHIDEHVEQSDATVVTSIIIIIRPPQQRQRKPCNFLDNILFLLYRLLSFSVDLCIFLHWVSQESIYSPDFPSQSIERWENN